VSALLHSALRGRFIRTFRPNNLRSMRMVYAGLPGVCVEPLHFASRDISGERLLSMMKVDESTRS
jgi:hypothetical protein